MGKAIKEITPANTELTDTQKRDYIPIFLPGGALGRRQISEHEIAQAAAQLPKGSSMHYIRTALYVKRTTTGRRRTVARIHFKNLCAPGPSGQRGEHAEQVYRLEYPTLKARWHRALDELTTMAMKGTLPDCCEWIFHTALTWLGKCAQQEA